MTTTPLYAALLAALFITLSVRTLRLRRVLRIALGDGGNPRMLRAIRAHANCAEYVPFSLMLLFLTEFAGAPLAFLHALGLVLLLGRVSHAYGVSQDLEDPRLRVLGMALTFTMMTCSAAFLAWHFFAGL